MLTTKQDHSPDGFQIALLLLLLFFFFFVKVNNLHQL